MFISRKAKLLSLTLGLLGAAVAAHADTQTFTPNPSNLNDLDHFHYYSWGIDYTMPATQQITSATLTIKNIYDWVNEDNDHLYITLLNSAPKGVKEFTDDQCGGDNWAGQGLRIADYQDPQGGSPRNFDLVVNFDATALAKLNTAALGNKIALGFDPDCHYFNSGVTLKFNTAPVPEPATMATIGLGIVGVIRRRKNRKA